MPPAAILQPAWIRPLGEEDTTHENTRRVSGSGYTLRSSSDPRGRLRGGVVVVPGAAIVPDAAAAGDPVFGDASGAIGAVTGGVVKIRTGCTPAGRPAWAGAAGPTERPAAGAGWPTALAMPMKVAGDNMPARLTGSGERIVNIGARMTSWH